MILASLGNPVPFQQIDSRNRARTIYKCDRTCGGNLPLLQVLWLTALISTWMSAGLNAQSPQRGAEAALRAAEGDTDGLDIQKIIDQRIHAEMAAGIAVGLIDGEQQQFYFAGALKAGTPKPIDGETIFEIGSISKVFTTLLLADMVEKGELNLTDSASSLLPPSVKMPTPDGTAITLEHLATHTSGLPRMPNNFNPKDASNPYADYTVEQMYEALSGLSIAGPISELSHYSNLGMGLLGHLLARKANQSYEELMIARICKPLGMTSTTTEPRAADAERVASGHQGHVEVSAWDIPTFAGAGDINSTVHDMVLFVAANMGMKETSLYSAMKKCHAERVGTADPQLKVGLGWLIWKKNGSEIIWHNGGTGGFAGFCGFRNDTRKGVVVLANSAFRGVDAIGLHLLNRQYELPKVPTAVAVPGLSLADYMGTYSLPLGQLFDVKIEKNQLLVKLSGQDFYPVYPESKDVFFYRIVEAKLTFKRNKDGQVDALVLHQGGLDQTAKKVDEPYAPKSVEIDRETLNRYVGEYAHASGLKFRVTIKKDQLWVRLTGQPAMPIYPRSETRFFYKEVIAEVSFQIDEAGNVKSLTLHQGGRDQVVKKVK